jgi:hypothetical protein
MGHPSFVLPTEFQNKFFGLSDFQPSLTGLVLLTLLTQDCVLG